MYASDILMVLFLFFFSLNFIQTKPVFENQNLFSQRGKSSFPSPSLVLISSKHHARSGCGIFSQTSLVWIFMSFLFISIFFASHKILALYNFVRLILLILTALSVAELLKRGLVSLEKILMVLMASAVFQSIIAFLQFLNQKSLGLRYLGESVLGAQIPGIAKIVVAGSKIIRAYGTFPHPNILAAFLLLGLFSAYYFLLKADFRNFFGRNFLIKILIALAIFVIILGLVLAFSRTAWILGLGLSLVYIGYVLIFGDSSRRKAFISVTLIAIFFLVIFIMNWLIFPRAEISLADQSVSQRISYNELGLYLLDKNPLGVGLGNQVIYSVKNGLYQIFGMNQVWQWQPIHNIYLLIGSEIGILGLIVFLVFMIGLLIDRFRFLIKNKNSEIGNLLLIVGLMFVSLLGFGLFDHFLWTLQPGRLMLWLVLGIILGIKGKDICPRS